MDSQSEYETPHWDDGAYEEGENEELEEEPEYEYYDENGNLIEPSLVDQEIDDSQSEYESSHGDDGGGKPSSIEEQDRLNKPEEGRGAAWRAGRRARGGPWEDRHDDASNLYFNKGFDLVIEDKEIWKKECTGYSYKPSCTCRKCGKIIENPPCIFNIQQQGFQCPYCVENERKQQQNGRPKNQGHPCDGRCGIKDCNKSFTKSTELKRHQEAHLKKYTCPEPNCPKHNDGYGGESSMRKHFRDKHKDLCESDGSCPQYGIPPKGTSHLRKPIKYDGKKITDAKWCFLKELVKTSIKNDIERKHKWTPEDQEYLKKINTNEYKHQITEKILDKLLERNMIRGGHCIDDAGGYLPNGFVLDRHSLYKLSLDRKNNNRPHFPPNTDNILENLSLVPIGMNTATNIVAVHRENTCDYVREKVEESQQKTKEDEYNLLSSQSKKFKKIRGKWKLTTLYSSCANIFSSKSRSGKKKGEYKDKECREKFETVDNFFKHCRSLLEKQRGYCAISGIFLENETSESHSPFKLSVDAIKPRDGHVPGNIRIICQFLNSTNNDNTKTHVAKNDQETAWTPESFKEYFQIPE